MAKGGRIFAGVFSIIGSGIALLIAWVLWLLGILGVIFGEPLLLSSFFIMLACGILGLIGGILLLVDKTAGGVLALIAGILDLILSIYLSVLGIELGVFIIGTVIVFLIPPAMMLTAGIVGLAVGSEFS